ncbi:hypothetical protein AAVH_16050 [Aphelenchoides avenae]|nr:hypothetical protein AAVH_16050 [Aphelenchus avenae]
MTVALVSMLLVLFATASTQPILEGTTGTTPSPPKSNLLSKLWISRGSLNPGHYAGGNLYVVRANGPLYLSCEVHNAKKTSTLKWFRETDVGKRVDMAVVDYARQAVSVCGTFRIKRISIALQASKYVGVTEFSLTFKNFTKEFVGNKFTCEAYEDGKKMDAREHVLILEKPRINNDALPTTGSTPSH